MSARTYRTSPEDIHAAEEKMVRSLASSVRDLKPFLSEKVTARLESIKKDSSTENGNDIGEFQQPTSITGATLRDYQIKGVSWLIDRYDKGISAILADEMGLGKTLQTISFIAYLRDVRKLPGPHLVVVPLSVLFNWQSECRKFCPSLRIFRVHTHDQKESVIVRERLNRSCPDYDLCITTYEMAKSATLGYTLQRMAWHTVILDEGHRIKNLESDTTRACCHLRACFKLILTGTPVQNNLHETYCLLHFLAPKIFDQSDRFDSCFQLNSSVVTVDRSALNEAHYMMRPFVLRRIKSEVEQKLPPKLETMILCPLSDMQRFWTKRILLKDSSLLARIEETYAQQSGNGKKVVASGQDWKKLQSMLAQLRKAANHPYLFPYAEADPQEIPTEEIVTASGKMVMLDRLLSKLKAKGHRVVLFSQYTRTLDIISDYLAMRDYSNYRLDGSTNRVLREVLITQFNKPDCDVFIFCLSTRAGGEGVNLYTADTVILFDSDWNPQVDIQAMARVHRIGQTKPVHIYRLVTGGTVEERIVQRAQKKLFLDSMVNRGSTAKAQEIDLQLKSKSSSSSSSSKRILSPSTSRSASDTPRSIVSMVSVGSLSSDGKTDQASATPSSDDDEDVDVVGEGAIPAAGADLTVTDEEADDNVDTSTIMSALKFGFNASFGVNATDGKASQEITDADLEAILDRARCSASYTTTRRDRGEESTSSNAASTTVTGSVVLGRSALLKEGLECTVADFEESAPLVDLRKLDGEALPKERLSSLADISNAWVEEQKRVRTSRLVQEYVVGVGSVSVLKSNMYNLQDGEPSVYMKELQSQIAKPEKQKRTRAGVDYDHQDFCQLCWDGGELICCDHCPAAYHPSCAGMGDTAPSWNWACSHHGSCTKCDKNRNAVGFLFRCEMCPGAYCEDCIPAEHVIVGECERWKKAGYRHPGSTIYVHCSTDCATFAAGPGMRIIADYEQSALGDDGKKRPATVSTTGSSSKKSKKGSHKRKK